MNREWKAATNKEWNEFFTHTHPSANTRGRITLSAPRDSFRILFIHSVLSYTATFFESFQTRNSILGKGCVKRESSGA